ncbi:MAG: septum formation family protein [Nocardioidaceae bacterium]|nr:septum formation family protein [Nocardioidaceae bacterium]
MAKRHRLVMGALVLVVLGCSSPPAAPPEEPQPEQVRAGDCFAAGSNDPVDCSQKHVAQAVYVGEEPPGSNAEALASCRRAQAKFLGQDFNTRLDILLWVAHDESSFRCDVVLRKSTQGGSGQVLTGSLEGAFRTGAAMDLRACLGAPYDPTADQAYAPCSEPHAAQALTVAPAIGTLEEGFPADIEERATNACNATAAAAGQLKAGRTVSAFYPESARAWATGERTAECWIAASRGSLPAVTSKAR